MKKINAILVCWLTWQLVGLNTAFAEQPAEHVDPCLGWATNAHDGKLELIVQIAPVKDSKLGPIKVFRVPDQLVGQFSRVVLRVTDAPLQREPSLELLKKQSIEQPREAESKLLSTNAASKEFTWVEDKSTGKLQAIIQVSPEMCQIMHHNHKEFASDVPPSVSMRIHEVAVTVGTDEHPMQPIRIAEGNAEVTDGDASLETLKRRCHELEQSAQALAEKLKASAQIGAAERSELAAAVSESLAARQTLRRTQIAELARRMKVLQQSVEAQEKMTDSIVEKKVNALLKSK